MKIEQVTKIYDDDNMVISNGDYIAIRVDNMKEKEYRGRARDIKDKGMHLELDNGFSIIVLFKNIINLEWTPY